MKFCQTDKIKHAPAYLMIVAICKLDKISVTANRCDYIKETEHQKKRPTYLKVHMHLFRHFKLHVLNWFRVFRQNEHLSASIFFSLSTLKRLRV